MKRKAYLTLVFLLIFGHSAHANRLIRADIIRKIESNNNCKAWNKSEDARGIHQIRGIVLTEYNNYKGTNYIMDDLWNCQLNREIGEWYLFDRIPQMLRYYNKEVNVRNIIISYNAGISYVVSGKKIPNITERYLRKYKKLNGNELK